MSTKICPYCAEKIKEAAIKCRYCGTMLAATPASQEWRRDLDGKMIGGVCSGLAVQFSVSATALRIAFVIAAFIGGWGLLIYLALWIIMPVARLPRHRFRKRRRLPTVTDGHRPPEVYFRT